MDQLTPDEKHKKQVQDNLITYLGQEGSLLQDLVNKLKIEILHSFDGSVNTSDPT